MQSVLVTGGTGSFGQAFVKRILEEQHVKRVVVYSRDELKQFEMARSCTDGRVRFFIGDVRDLARLRRAFVGIDTVVHAAALKQIVKCEYDPEEAIKTNINGVMNVINAAIDSGVANVIGLSTDKAVCPVNLYGATKLSGERLFIAGNHLSGERGTRFSVVRYGNVVGSRGSVVPFFRDRARMGVIPITDARMTRFWLTLEQGCEFVLMAAKRMRGGEVFVPKLPATKVVDIAEAIAPGCKQQVIGIRPGEKLHETLICREEAANTHEFLDHYVIYPAVQEWGPQERWGKPVQPGFEYTSADAADVRHVKMVLEAA